jgi:anti-anti-sigma factor
MLTKTSSLLRQEETATCTIPVNSLPKLQKKITGGCSKAVLDLNEVNYLDSSGVGAIIKIIRLAKEKQITLTFRGIKGTPRKVLDMSNILSLIIEEP